MGRITLFLLSAVLHLVVGVPLVPALTAWPWLAVCVAAWLAGSAVLMPLALIGRRGGSLRRRTLLAWTGMVAMGAFSSLFVFGLLRDLLLLADTALVAVWPEGAASTGMPEASALAVLAATAAVTGVGVWNARRTAAVVRVDVPIRGLAPALHGFTIAQISDIHVGATIRSGYVQAIVDRVNSLDADMVAVTGDLVDGSVAELSDHVAPLQGLVSRHGTFFVTGNHEFRGALKS